MVIRNGLVAPVPQLFCSQICQAALATRLAEPSHLSFFSWILVKPEKLSTLGQVAEEEVGILGEIEARVDLEEE